MQYSLGTAQRYYSDISDALLAQNLSNAAVGALDISSDFQHCLLKLNQYSSGKPKGPLALVVSVTPERLDLEELQSTTENMKAYAAQHGYSFYLQTVKPGGLFNSYSARWMQLVSSQIWQEHEWVLHLDSDSIFVDFKKTFEQYTSSSSHLFLQIRLNKEVTAAAVLVRTSAFAGRCQHTP